MYDRETIRQGSNMTKETVMFLYGRLRKKKRAVAYCQLHKCYLEPKDIKEKRCNYKNCKYKEEL